MIARPALIALALLGLASPLHSHGNELGQGRLPDCRPDWMWEPDAHMRKLPRCNDKDTSAKMPPKPAGGSANSSDNSNRTSSPPRLPGYPDRSCWAAPASCLQTTSAWGESKLDRESRRFYTYHKNACAHRIYVRACIEREDMKPYCGSSGVEPGKTWHWSVSRSTGRYRAMHVGVISGKDDIACPKPPEWKELAK